MRRREFITLLGGAAAAWPLAARAQQVDRMRRVGVLRVARDSTTSLAAWQGFLDSLRRFGFTPGVNLIADMRWVDEDPRGPAAVAAELVQTNLDVLVVEGAEAYLQAAIAASPTVPIVMGPGNYDPIERGYIASLAQPGGRITGVFVRRPELAEKQVDLLAQAFPDRRRLALLWDPHSADQYAVAERVARSLGLDVLAHKFERPPYDVDGAFRRLAEGAPQLLLVQSSPLFVPHGRRIAELAIRHLLPTMFITRSYVEFGGLMCYGPDRVAAVRLTGNYVGHILAGRNAADLPVQQPTKFELILNLKTAKALGIEVPPTLLTRADEVIE